ncbi:MAG: DeoR/GlpR family DNA-binding transcription regulator [Bacillus sp. (in: firmicutes)]
MGRIEYLFGGAVKLLLNTGELPISKKLALNHSEKEDIAELAEKEIYEGDTIYLDSGSSCSLLLGRILNKKITVYTTNTNIFSVSGEIAAEIILIGGHYNPIISSLSGPLADENLQSLYFDKAFLGVNGIDEEKGVTTPNVAEAMKKRLIKKNSNKTYLLCDSTKFHKFSNVKAFDLRNVTLISDKYDKKIGEYVEILTSSTKKGG